MAAFPTEATVTVHAELDRESIERIPDDVLDALADRIVVRLLQKQRSRPPVPPYEPDRDLIGYMEKKHG